MKNKKLQNILLVSILVLAFGTRLAFLLLVPPPPIGYDALNYDIMVRQIIEKNFYAYAFNSPNAYTTPGFPIFLTIIYKIFGYSNGSPLMAVRIIQILLAVLTVWLIYMLGKLVANARVGLLAAFLASIYVVAIWVPTTILTETLYNCLFFAYLYVQFLAFKKRKNAIHAAAGVLLGLAVLTRPVIAPLIFLPYIYHFIADRDKTVWKSMFFNLAGFVGMMLPWWIRNLVVLKQFIPFATQSDPLLRGTYPYDVGIENIPLTDQNAEAYRRLIEGFTTQPLLYLGWYTIGKFRLLYFKLYFYVDGSLAFLRSVINLHFIFVWFGWLGVVWSLIRKELRLLSLYLVLMTGASLIFVATSRYSYSLIHILIILTAVVLDFLFTNACGKDKKVELDKKTAD